IQRPSKLILISGPSGSGKSTCLRILAASLNINIVEWETRTTTALTSTVLDEQRDLPYKMLSLVRSDTQLNSEQNGKCVHLNN
ncbi:unnamed protein product, partial [Rotaria sordida]